LTFRFSTNFINKLEVHSKFIVFGEDINNKKLPFKKGS
jgi:hypothetical protein